MKDTITANIPEWGALTFDIPVNSPARASALLALSSAVVRGTSSPDEVRAHIDGSAGTLEDVEAQFDRLYASHGLLIGYTLRLRDGQPWTLDAVKRGHLPTPACPECGSTNSTVGATRGRLCVDCKHAWRDPDDERRYVGPEWRADFGRAVIAELQAAGVPFIFLGKIGAALHGALSRLAGAGVEAGADVSFS